MHLKSLSAKAGNRENENKTDRVRCFGVIARSRHGRSAAGKLDTARSSTFLRNRSTARLTDFAQASGLQLLVLSDIAHGRIAPTVSGSLTPEKALQRLLVNSGLEYRFVNERTVAISQIDLSAASSARAGGQSRNTRRAQAESSSGPEATDADADAFESSAQRFA